MVRTGRVELPFPCGSQILSLVRLPIPPRSQLTDSSELRIAIERRIRPEARPVRRFWDRGSSRGAGLPQAQSSCSSASLRNPTTRAGPQCASHSVASSLFLGLRYCSNTGTPKAFQSRFAIRGEMPGPAGVSENHHGLFQRPRPSRARHPQALQRAGDRSPDRNAWHVRSSPAGRRAPAWSPESPAPVSRSAVPDRSDE